MSGAFTVRVNMGAVISKAVRDIDSYDAEKQKRIRQVIADGTKAVRDRAVQAAPKGPTGKLRKGIRSSLVGDGREGIVTSTAPHSALVELGTGDRLTYSRKGRILKFTWKGRVRYRKGPVNTGRMKPQRFLRKAADQEWPRIVRHMEDALK
mgnify:CR=1 FL=1